ncbi:hypothetical protein [Flavobacterium sp.]|uniref:hypothetical protein n=1 Tax=Flavobacterium sp. TaxID=239 RepID=UPI0026071FDA|nr:hypothetical protein [Flavobacterium sp.]
MQVVNLSIQVKTTSVVSTEDIVLIVQRLIDVGLDDASKTVRSDDGDFDSARLATELQIEAPTVAKQPRVLVVVQGGVAEHFSDNGVDVEIFDWDDYNVEEDASKVGVPAQFADIATPNGVPVREVIGQVASSEISEPCFTSLLQSGVTDYCNQVCGGGECGSGPVCHYCIDLKTHMPAVAG